MIFTTVNPAHLLKIGKKPLSFPLRYQDVNFLPILPPNDVMRAFYLFSLLTISLLLMGTPSQAQVNIDWYTLSHVNFSTPEADHRAPVYGAPSFGDTVKALEGQTVILDGYMLPLTVDNKLYVLSKYPFTECFFCGGAGKETVVELRLQKEMRFDIDEPVTIQGQLRLVHDPMEISYQIVDAHRVD